MPPATERMKDCLDLDQLPSELRDTVEIESGVYSKELLDRTDLWKYYEASEKINLQIFRAFEEQGIQFSLPVRHSFWKQDDKQGPLDVRLLGDRVSKSAETHRPDAADESRD